MFQRAFEINYNSFMNKIILVLLVTSFLTIPIFSQNHKFEYGITPAAVMFPVGNNFADNFEPSIGFGMHGFYNVTGAIALGLDGAYTFHFVNKTYNGLKIKVMRFSPSVKLQKYLGKLKIYLLLGYGLYYWQSTAIITPGIPSKSRTVSGFNGEAGVMFVTAHGWELGVNAGYNYVNDIGGFKPARYLTPAIKVSLLL